MFKKEVYQTRRQRLAQNIDSGILLFIANEITPMNFTDNEYHFRQDSTFMYYFDLCDRPGIAAVIDIDENKDIVFADEDPFENVVWSGPTISMKEQVEMVGIEHLLPRKSIYDYIKKALAQKRKIHFLPPYKYEHNILIQELLHIPFDKQQDEVSIDFIKGVVNMRNYKSDEEIVEIEKAVNISYKMHTAAMKIVQPGQYEYEVMAEINKTAYENNCQLSFPTICTTHGETLHNHIYSHKLEKGRMMLVDAGAELPNGYAGDISSTFPIYGKFSDRQKTIYDIVAASHKTAVDALKPHALFFQCGLGHMMGLDVHDMESLGEVWVGYDGEPKSTQFGMRSLRLGRKLEPGFVLTIEPGIYLIPELIDMWKNKNKFNEFINYSEVEKWKYFGGIRNEEDYLITKEGKRRLGDGSEKAKLLKTFFE